MSTFVLIHGGWHGAWCWDEVASRLRAAGHDVQTPTLTGLGDLAHLLNPNIDLETHQDDVVTFLTHHELTDVILVGHSYGGMVIAGVADRAPSRIARLIFLDAFVSEDGQSLFDLLRPERRDRYQEQARQHGDGWRVPPPSPTAFGITDEREVQLIAARLSPQPIQTFQQAVHLTGAASAISRTYILCTTGPLVPGFAPFADRARSTPGWSVYEIATGHDAMLTAPIDLTDLLLSLSPSE